MRTEKVAMLNAHVDVREDAQGVTESLRAIAGDPEIFSLGNGYVRHIFTRVPDRDQFMKRAHEVSLSPVFAET